MPKYLTVAQYKLADDGLNLAAISDRSLARYIARAEGDIDAYMGFDLMRGGFEPHYTWMQAYFNEKTLKITVPGYPVPVRQITRYRIQVSNLTTSGAGFFADINSGDCVINTTHGYIEIVPLQAVTYSLSPVLLQLGLRPPLVQVDCETGYFLPVFGEVLTPVDNSYLTYAAVRGFWATTYTQALATQPNVLPPVPPVVYVNGTATNSYSSINSVEGTITFAASQQANTISADYTYSIPDVVRDACIDQVTYLFGLRQLNQLGLTGLGMIRNGDMEIRSIQSFPARFVAENGALCEQAAHKLATYKSIPIA